ncbi:MAG TPA: hypothetical protein VKH41_05840, partial [Myxococcota bacterium]|nr:hypothetical protein [Myxococcota bacterium]
MSAPANPSAALAQVLRTGATRAARAAGGGVVLLYAAGESGPEEVLLRAAAGFAAPEHARTAGSALAPRVGKAMRANGVSAIEMDGIALGARAAGGVRVHPLLVGSQLHGALVVGSPAAPTAEQAERIAEIVEGIAIHLDHARLARECSALSAKSAAPDP